MKKVDLYHLIQTALHCIHLSSWELLGLREIIKPSFVLFMNACKVCQSLQSRQERKERKLLIFKYNLLPGWLGQDSVSCGYTSLAESPAQAQVKMCLCRYIPKALGG